MRLQLLETSGNEGPGPSRCAEQDTDERFASNAMGRPAKAG